MNTRILKSVGCVFVAGALLASQRSADASVIYRDTFSGAAGTLLNGHSPDIANGFEGGTSSATWTAATATGTPSGGGSGLWTLDGNGNVAISSAASLAAANGDDANLIANASIPFTPVTGLIYDLQITLAPTLANGTSGNWLGIAFTQAGYNGHGISGQALSNNNCYGLAILKPTGVLQTFGGIGTGNGVTNTAGTVNTANPQVLDLILNTENPLWSITWALNGTSVGSYTYAANPSIGLISFGTNKHEGSVTSFSLTSNSVPEPMAASLLALPALGLIRRRR